LKHLATHRFWRCFDALPEPTQAVARKNLDLLKMDHRHPSLHFKKIGQFYSIRIGLSYRALAVKNPDGLTWFWVGNHSDYDKLIK
jgi:hypothetical protein